MIAFAANHLWQSTLAVLVVALLVPCFGRSRAQVRYGLWLAASLKFVVPFAILIAIGSRAAWRTAPPAEPRTMLVIDFLSEPFGSPATAGTERQPKVAPFVAVARALAIAVPVVWLAGGGLILLAWSRRWREVARAVRSGTVAREGVEAEALQRVAARLGSRRSVSLVLSDTRLEPGVFGIVRPVLLWPRSIGERLDARQIEAIIAHEIAHVQRHDNLAAAVHMCVQALFWFHPFVWWLGAKLVDERERACDEDVVRMGCDPQAYAEGIVRTCELYVESPLVCVAGVTGSDLNRRIERIMKNEPTADLSSARKLLLATAAVAAISLPVAIGVVTGPRLRAQTAANDATLPVYVDVVVKRHVADALGSSAPPRFDGEGFRLTNLTLRSFIANAYDIPLGQISGAPDWIGAERYDIEARVSARPAPNQRAAMMRKLLEDTFKLSAHVEIQQLPVYALVKVRSDGTLGPNIRPSACTSKDSPPPASRTFDPARMPVMPCGASGARPTGVMQARWQTMAEFAKHTLPGLVGRQVVDRTGLTGSFDLDVEFTPEPMGPLPPVAPGGYGRPAPFVGTAFFTALQEQLGLTLASEAGSVDMLVIDRIERPAP
jgi:bla regulator protein blaR1